MPRGRPKSHVAPCSFCAKQFRRQEHLTRHERTHTQEKPFACKRCNQGYTRKDLLVRHMRTAHTVDNVPRPEIDYDDIYDRNDPNHGVSQPTQSTTPLVTPGTHSSHNNAVSSHNSRATSSTEEPNRTLGGAINVAGLQASSQNNTDFVSGRPMERPQTLEMELQELGPKPGSFSIGHSTGISEEPFIDVDGIDWLWSNDDPNSLFLSVPLPDESFLSGLENSFLYDDMETSGYHTNALSQETHSQELSGIASGTPAHVNLGKPHLTLSSPGHSVNVRTIESQQGSALWTLDEDIGTTGDPCYPWRITKASYEQICSNVGPRTASLPTRFAMPSRHTLSRFAEGYFRGFHEHLPFLHLPTLSLADLPAELVLSIIAMGALYKFEHGKAYELYFAAKELVSNRLTEQTWAHSRLLVGMSPNYNGTSTGLQPIPSTSMTEPNYPQGPSIEGSESSEFLSPDKILHLTQALVILTSMGSWGEGALITEGLELAGRLNALVRLSYYGNSDAMPDNVCWKGWIRREERRRTLLVAYTLLNTQSIAFNVPPGIVNRDIGLYLPHPTNLWRAATAAKWLELKENSPHHERSFRDTLNCLLSGREVPDSTQISAFGNFIMIHALNQHIFFERQVVSLRGYDSPLGSETLKMMDQALRSWQRCWGRTTEATLDPLSPNGPIPFNSTALLRIAYIRMNADLGPYRHVFVRNPTCLASSVASTPTLKLDRTPYTDIAVLQCIHALGIIVRSGVEFVSRTHTQSWSIVHSLSSIECACLLSLWLRTVADLVSEQGMQGLRKEEAKLLRMTTSVVLETPMADNLEEEQDAVVRVRKLAACTVKVWADSLKGKHMFQMVQTIAKGLSLAAEVLIAEVDEEIQVR